ncbi:hypothetical protein ANO11243_032100 [Dothideomycetidae sp. 11243]|nr:hypothetical protein ANO11243_032100 [fungal sp. No.11243]
MRASLALGLATLTTLGNAQGSLVGFNYGNEKSDGSGLKVQADYETEFNAAKQLVGTNGQYTSARLYTMLQGAPSADPISAIAAALATGTSLLLGLWCSAGEQAFQLELQGLSNALSQYGEQLKASNSLVGISVGSEDLYRNSPLGAGGNPGANPSTLVDYINRVRNVVSQSQLAGTPIGHVDTWNAWVNSSNSPVISASDFIGMNGFPYFQSTNDNRPANLAPLFSESLKATEDVAQGKPVWVTETGFPVTGPTYNEAIPALDTAHDYYHNVGCGMLFGQRNTWWYTLQDAPPSNQQNSNPSFGIVGWPDGSPPLYDLNCAAARSTSSSGTSATALTPSAPLSVPNVPLSMNSSTPATSSFVTLPSPSSSVITTSSATPPPQPSSSSCPSNLNGNFEFPHLIVPVSSSSPNTAFGTQYSATINSTTSSLFNFDIPASDKGKTCTLAFFWSSAGSYNFDNQGGLAISLLSSPANQGTTYSNAPASQGIGAIGSAAPGNSYIVTTRACPSGQTIGYRLDSVGGLALTYFQNYDPNAPMGLFVTIC